MVENVEGLRLELEGKPLVYFEVLKYSEVGSTDRLASLGVPSQRRERCTEKLLGINVVDYKVCLVQCDRVSGVHANETAARCRWVHALANRVEWSGGIPRERSARIKCPPGKVGWVAQPKTCVLLHRPWLTAAIAVGSIDLPSANQAP